MLWILWVLGMIVALWGLLHILASGFFWGMVLALVGVAIMFWAAGKIE